MPVVVSSRYFKQKKVRRKTAPYIPDLKDGALRRTGVNLVLKALALTITLYGVAKIILTVATLIK